jgi:hypothetical protein
VTEAQWLKSKEPSAMLSFRPKKGSKRKLRLFACACVRRVWRQLQDERSRQGIEVAERFADGETQQGELKKACAEALDAGVALPADDPANHCPRFAASAAYCATKPSMSAATARVAAHESDVASKEREASAQARLMRCVFGNPFRPATLDPTWQTPTVTALAQAAYDERELPSGALDKVRLSVLADALEEAGCGADVFGHLREKGPHVRGCWVIDLILGKE